MTRSARTSVVKATATPTFLLLTGFFMLSYLCFQAAILNYSLISHTLTSASSLSYKTHLLYYILTGYLQSMPTLYLTITLGTAALLGINLTLTLLNYIKAKQMGGMKLAFGGSSLFALVSSGCPSCGLTALSLLGPSTGAFSFLLHDLWLQVVIIAVLLLSIGYSLIQMGKEPVCYLPTKR